MRNFKLVIGFSAFGFLLSLISGFVSHSKAGAVFLHAVIFAVVFAALGFLLEFVFEHVLEANLSSMSDAPAMEGAGQGASARQGGAGHKVDFYVEDESLPNDNESPRFLVSSPRNIFSEMDEKSGSSLKNSTPHKAVFAPSEGVLKSAESDTPSASLSPSVDSSLTKSEQAVEKQDVSSSAQPQNASSHGFVPISLGEAPSHFSGAEVKKIEDSKPLNEPQQTAPQKKESADDDELDELPDMESIGTASPSYGSGGFASDDDGGEEDSGYVKAPSRSSVNEDINEFASGQDTQLMAKAISTLLASE